MNDAEQHCIIIGAAHAGSQLAISLRQGGWRGGITLIGEEPDLPYHRPPLSKEYLSGEKKLDEIQLRPAATYEKAEINLVLGVRVDAIDRRARIVTLDGGDTLSYDKLVLATGTRVRRLPIAGEGLPGVFYLRDTRDVRAINAEVGAGKRAVIIGGGYIGLETAASLRKKGMEITVLETMPRILQRVTAPELSDFYRRIHTEEGVKIFENVVASEIATSGTGLSVQTENKQDLPADMVIIAIGVIPNVELAKEAGLAVGQGIDVNQFCETSDPDISAIGDVTWHFNPVYGRHVRLESVPNAIEQAKTVALALNGNPKPYNSLPWFWSDQFDLKLQIAGLSGGYDDIVIRGDRAGSRSFAAFYFEGDKLLAVDAVNRPRAFMLTRQALTKGMKLEKDILRNENAALKSAIRD